MMYGDRGWGVACSRDDIGPGPDGRSANYFSRLEMSIRPLFAVGRRRIGRQRDGS